ncbi:MAG TPA: hypothetical protein ENJ00_06845 [Phycisphaerales bacterium]|nr:hypothetical protein [Phycisphaerales bacterium]
MNNDQLRQALAECSGRRDVQFCFTGVADAAALLTIHAAMIIPDEEDHLIKLTDGRSEYIIDAERVAWLRIGAEHEALTH